MFLKAGFHSVSIAIKIPQGKLYILIYPLKLVIKYHVREKLDTFDSPLSVRGRENAEHVCVIFRACVL